MAFGFFKIFKGLNLVPKVGSTANSLGDIEVNSSTNKANFHNGTTVSPLVTEAHTATLTNKTMDANSNTFSNFEHGVEVNNPSSGVHGVTGNVVGTTDSQTLTNKTIVAGNNTISGLLHGTQVDNPSSGVHGVVGTVVGTSDSQVLTNKTIDADLNTITNIENADIKAGAAIARNKLASGSNNHVIINDGSGIMSSEAQLAITRGGTGQSTASTAFGALSPLTTKGDLLSYDTANNRLPVGTDGQVLTADSAEALGVKWAAAANTQTSSYDLLNCESNFSVAGNALTWALKTDSGSDPSGGDPIKVSIKSATATSGVYTQYSITSAISLVISSGSTLGTRSGQAAYLYGYIGVDGSTPFLAISHSYYDDGSIVSTTAEGGAGAADSNSVIYSTSAHVNCPIRCVVMFKSTQATAGTWATVPTNVFPIPFIEQKVAAIYESNTVQAMVNGTPTIVNFEDVVVDTHSAVTVGASWVFTAPKAMLVNVEACVTLVNVSFDATETFNMQLFKNGSTHKLLDNRPGVATATIPATLQGSTLVQLAANDTLQIKIEQNTGANRDTSSVASNVYCSIYEVTFS